MSTQRKPQKSASGPRAQKTDTDAPRAQTKSAGPAVAQTASAVKARGRKKSGPAGRTRQKSAAMRPGGRLGAVRLSAQASLGPIGPVCGARTRAGGACINRPVGGKRRCRMHGGAAGSGAPKGNKNALKHGYFSAEQKEGRRQKAEIWRETAGQITTLSQGLHRVRSFEEILGNFVTYEDVLLHLDEASEEGREAIMRLVPIAIELGWNPSPEFLGVLPRGLAADVRYKMMWQSPEARARIIEGFRAMKEQQRKEKRKKARAARARAARRGKSARAPRAKAAQGKPVRGKAAQGKAAQGKAAQGKAAQGKAALGNAAQGKAAQGKAAQGNAAQGNAAQGKSVRGKAVRSRAVRGKAAQSQSQRGKPGRGRPR